MNSERQQRKDMEDLAHRFGCGLEMNHTRGGHVRAIFRFNTKQAALVMAKGYGGDWRGRTNNLTRARRQLRELTGRVE